MSKKTTTTEEAVPKRPHVRCITLQPIRIRTGTVAADTEVNLTAEQADAYGDKVRILYPIV
jgi:hypothetical protein